MQGEKGENGLPGHDGKPVSILCLFYSIQKEQEEYIVASNYSNSCLT